MLAVSMLVFANNANAQVEKTRDCFVFKTKDRSKVDMNVYNSLKTEKEQVNYLLEKKEMCHGLTLALKGGFNFDAGAGGALAIGYRFHYLRPEIEINYFRQKFDEQKYYTPQMLVNLYFDFNKHNNSAIRPYIGVGVGYTWFDKKFATKNDVTTKEYAFKANSFTMAATAGCNFRLAYGFWAFAEARYDTYKIEVPMGQSTNISNIKLMIGLRINFN